jgi:two-component system chemotaxis response regulator CheB
VQIAPKAVVVIGASAGGVDALRSLVGRLPADLDASVCVTLHIPRTGVSALPQILSRAGVLPATHPQDGDALRAGHVYVAPANRHLLLHEGHVRLSPGPSENGHRPAIDPLFRSAARYWGPRAAGVVLSGARDDGTAGLAAIVARGGAAFVQAPQEAVYPWMPRNAIEHVPGCQVLPVAELGQALMAFTASVHRPVHGPGSPPVGDPLLEAENAMTDMGSAKAEDLKLPPAGFGCPSCHGGLFELPSVPSPRFRCRVGHAWSAESLLEEQAEQVEGALWVALRSLEEKAGLSARMSASALHRGSVSTAERYQEVGAEAAQASAVIRDLIARINAINGVRDQAVS